MMKNAVSISRFIFILAVCLYPVKLNPIGERINYNELMQELLNWNLPELQQLQSRFSSSIDTNRDSVATYKEIKKYLQKYSPDVSDREVENFIQRRDLNGDNQIQFIPEYLRSVAIPDYTSEGAAEMFRLMDRNKDGRVSRDEIATISKNLGMRGKELRATVDGYYMMVDSDGNKSLDWKEFRNLYRP